MSVALGIFALTFPCWLALTLEVVSKFSPSFNRFCDRLFPDTPHSGRLS